MATIKNLDELQQLVIQFCSDRDWNQFHNPKDLAISLVLEASEVLEHFQWKDKEEVQKHIKDKKEDIGDELADVFYWILLLSNNLKIDLSEAFVRKLQKSAEKYPIEKARGKHTKYTEL